MGDFIQDCIRDGSLVMYHDYTSGCGLDWSGNGNHAIFPPTTVFTGRGLRVFSVNPAQAIVAPSIDLSNTPACSMMWKLSTIGEPFNTLIVMPSNWTVVTTSIFIGSVPVSTKRFQVTNKGNAGYNSWYTSNNGTPPRVIFGATFDKSQVGANEVRGYIDGAVSGAAVATPNNTNNFGDHVPYMGKSSTTPCVCNIESVMLFNRALTAEEHQTLYRELK